MSLKVNSISELDPSLVLAAQDQLTQLIQERYPDIELSRGVIHDTVLFLHAICGGLNQTEINRVLESRSLLALQTNPLLADPELVDHVLSNFLITRKVGTRATGNITIVVESDATMVIAANSLYVGNGLNFRVDTAITARPPGTVTTATTERVLEPRGDGTFEFTVPATAEDIGDSYNIRINTKLNPDPLPQRFVTAFSADDFTGGQASETNTQLVERMEAGVAAKVTAGRSNITALLREQAVFADLKNVSIIGYGDPEMERDQHWIFPVSGGGRIDIYCQMDSLPITTTIKRTARLIEKRTTDSIWQLSINRNDSPGFYEVANIRRLLDPTDVAGFEITSDVRGWDFGDDQFRPDIKYGIEAAYTRYQTAVVQFIDNATPVAGLTVGDEAEYSVSLLTQRRIREVQEFLGSIEHRHLAADVLVKSAIPCFVSLNFDIVKAASESSPNIDLIRVAIADRVNNMNFPGTLYASQVLDVVHNYLVGSQAVSEVDMHGLIRRPDGTTTVIRSTSQLTIPNAPSTLVTQKTTIFILDPGDIGIRVVNRSN